jgi:hypothetical protein
MEYQEQDYDFEENEFGEEFANTQRTEHQTLTKSYDSITVYQTLVNVTSSVSKDERIIFKTIGNVIIDRLANSGIIKKFDINEMEKLFFYIHDLSKINVLCFILAYYICKKDDKIEKVLFDKIVSNLKKIPFNNETVMKSRESSIINSIDLLKYCFYYINLVNYSNNIVY